MVWISAGKAIALLLAGVVIAVNLPDVPDTEELQSFLVVEL